LILKTRIQIFKSLFK